MTPFYCDTKSTHLTRMYCRLHVIDDLYPFNWRSFLFYLFAEYGRIYCSTCSELARSLKALDWATACLVRGTEEYDRCALSAWLLGDRPNGPRNTWVYRDPFLRVEDGTVTFRTLHNYTQAIMEWALIGNSVAGLRLDPISSQKTVIVVQKLCLTCETWFSCGDIHPELRTYT